MAEKTFQSVIVGTAGHIDHGKTTLVKALTGQDADRLPEEKSRGITIDLGFAHMTLPSGQPLAFIDVPGHERFIRNMVAGVHGMDAVMLVVAADEGIMPQTEEHLAILRLLGVQRGFTVITKSDLVDEEMLQLVRTLVAEAVAGTFLEGAPVVACDALSGRNMGELIAELERLTHSVKRPTGHQLVRLPVDWVFSVKGFGTVVTGTLGSGRIRLDDTLELVPAGVKVRVRGLQVHNRSVEEAGAGQRVVVNLAGVDRADVDRGMAVATPGSLHGVDVAGVDLELLPGSTAVAERTRVHVHAGTAEALARVHYYDRSQLEPGQRAFAELRFETPIPLTRRDRVLVRSYSPVVTIGGGVALEVGVHHRRRESGLLARLARLADGDDLGVISEVVAVADQPMEVSAVARAANLSEEEVRLSLPQLDGVVVIDDRYLWDLNKLEKWAAEAYRQVEGYIKAHPIKPGMPRDDLRAKVAPKWSLRVFQAVLVHAQFVLDREWVRLAPESVALSEAHRQLIDRIEDAIARGGLKGLEYGDIQQETRVQGHDFEDIVEHLFLQGRILRLEDGLVIARAVFETGRQMIAEAIRSRGPLSTAELKEVLGISRRHAVLFLELLDRERITRRVGDSRELVS